MIEYVQRVLEQRTTVNDDTSAERLAGGIVTSILSRLDFGFSQSAGGVETIETPFGAMRVHVTGGMPEGVALVVASPADPDDPDPMASLPRRVAVLRD